MIKLMFLLTFHALFSIEQSPIGKWKIIDEKTGKIDSIVEIKEVEGKIEAVVIENFSREKICHKCTGANKDMPIQGMKILKDLKKNGIEWTDGKILDPKTGDTYSVKIQPTDNGQKLKVRGFLGIELLGVTLLWEKVD